MCDMGALKRKYTKSITLFENNVLSVDKYISYIKIRDSDFGE